MCTVAVQFDVAVDDSTQRCAHRDVRGNPSWENPHHPVVERPHWCPRKTDECHPEGLDLAGHPTEDGDDENHCEHHRSHHRCLHCHLLRHQLHLQLLYLVRPSCISGHLRISEFLANLALTMSKVSLSQWIHEECPNDGAYDHNAGTDDEHRRNEVGRVERKEWYEDIARPIGQCHAESRVEHQHHHHQHQEEHRHHHRGHGLGLRVAAGAR